MSSSQVRPNYSFRSQRLHIITLAALGVVFGDIGTSPLYALKECFSPEHGIAFSPDAVLGIISMLFWAITIVVSLKYVLFVMRADNNGEGGVLALMALSLRTAVSGSPRAKLLMMLGVFGACMFYGDVVITPAISVLSAVEGLEIAVPGASHVVIPLTLVILVGLFLIQRHGTNVVGKLFGPIMFLWFISLGALGIYNIIKAPEVLVAINPYYAVHFMIEHSLQAFIVLGSVVLVLTGAEALYADMGHFGIRPIRFAWLYTVMPCLVINYFGQGANLLINPDAIKNPFYLMVPDMLLVPMVVLATFATVIASQAVISGAFSLTSQAILLGFVPRMRILHTSEDERGQIYIPLINWMLLVLVVAVVLAFKKSDNLAAAYGVAVTTTDGDHDHSGGGGHAHGMEMASGAGDAGDRCLLPGRRRVLHRQSAQSCGWRLVPVAARCCRILPADDLVFRTHAVTHPDQGRWHSAGAVRRRLAGASAASRRRHGRVHDR